jgi:Universal stress protein UspA and related nucleotide-binding proteins
MEEKNGRKLKVLVAIDGSELGNMVIKRSGQFARVTNCDLTVLNVVEPLPGSYAEMPGAIADFTRRKKEEAEEIVAKAQKTLKHYGVDCKTKIGVGPVASEILEVSEQGNFDVIFVGSRGFGGLKRMLLGSVAD